MLSGIEAKQAQSDLKKSIFITTLSLSCDLNRSLSKQWCDYIAAKYISCFEIYAFSVYFADHNDLEYMA